MKRLNKNKKKQGRSKKNTENKFIAAKNSPIQGIPGHRQDASTVGLWGGFGSFVVPPKEHHNNNGRGIGLTTGDIRVKGG